MVDDGNSIVDYLLFCAWEIDEIVSNSDVVESRCIVCGIYRRAEVISAQAIAGDWDFLKGDREEGDSHEGY